jgi:hypothetical protein
MWWHTVTHGRGSEGKTGEWSGQPVLYTLPRHMVYPELLPLMHTTRLPVVDWTDAPADLNGLVRFAEGRNMVSARAPSHFKHSLQQDMECAFNLRLCRCRVVSCLCVPDRSQIVTWPLLSVHSGPTVCCCEHVQNGVNITRGSYNSGKKNSIILQRSFCFVLFGWSLTHNLKFSARRNIL